MYTKLIELRKTITSGVKPSMLDSEFLILDRVGVGLSQRKIGMVGQILTYVKSLPLSKYISSVKFNSSANELINSSIMLMPDVRYFDLTSRAFAYYFASTIQDFQLKLITEYTINLIASLDRKGLVSLTELQKDMKEMNKDAIWHLGHPISSEEPSPDDPFAQALENLIDKTSQVARERKHKAWESINWKEIFGEKY
ncbi:MAG TPA: hypothetical protein DC049_09230 [Spirochaetia bacterium]|nr:hypothetical protein [Spirochaetia bacterium]